MARPKKDNADYFSHDSDMRNDPKIKALRKNFGFKGYAIWCYLLEFLTDSDYFEIEWTDLNIELLSGDFDCETNDLKSIVEYCIKINLLDIENDKLYSFQHKKRFDSLLSKRKRDRNRVFDSENPQSKVKESKVNKSKYIPAFEEFKNYALEKVNNINVKSVELKYNAWLENDWKDGNDKKITNWKSKLSNTLTYLPKDEANKSNKTERVITPSKNIETKW